MELVLIVNYQQKSLFLNVQYVLNSGDKLDCAGHRRRMYIEGKAKVVVDFLGEMAAC